MNKEKQELLDEVYENYLIEDSKVLPNMLKEKMTEMGFRLSKEEFINKCKTDTEFSEKWGLKIVERELILEERKQIVKNKYFQEFYWKIVDDDNDVGTIFEMDRRNIPTRLTTITYNDKRIESYDFKKIEL
jgi:hypothetical protein